MRVYFSHRALVFTALFLVFSSVCVSLEAQAPEKPDKLKAVEPDAGFAYAPDFRLKDLADKEVALSDYKGKENVILFFWASWCPYCRAELKVLNNEYASLKKPSVELLAINVGEPKYKVSNFEESRKLIFRVLLDQDSQVADSYGLMGVPTYFVVNKSGQIIFSGNHYPKDKIQELTVK